MKMKTRKNGLNTLVVVSLGCAMAGAAPAADLAAAKDNFKSYCSKCHGASGQGNGPDAATLNTKPRDFSDCDRMAKMSDDALFKVIKEGGASAGLSKDMASFQEGFDDPEIRDLVAYVRTFCKK
jgi:cytochrome c oxidase cbb3-type subunit III